MSENKLKSVKMSDFLDLKGLINPILILATC